MNVLIAETCLVTPHLEVSAELALQHVARGDRVSMAFPGLGLPYNEFSPTWARRLLGCGDNVVVRQLSDLLSPRVEIQKQPRVPNVQLQAARRFASVRLGDLASLKALHFNGLPIGMGVASSIISQTRDSVLDVHRHKKLIANALYSSVVIFERMCMLLRQSAPDLVLTFNGRFATTQAIVLASQVCGVPVKRHERGAMKDRFELFDDSVHSFSYTRARIEEAWGHAPPGKREHLGREFFNRRRAGDGIGWKTFTDGQIAGLDLPRVRGRSRLVYFSSSDDEYEAIADSTINKRLGSQLEVVNVLIEFVRDRADMELILRIHPHLRNKSDAERRRWHGLSGPNVALLPADSQVDSYALMESADLVLAFGSTAGIEAAFWGRPVILLSEAIYSEMDVCYEPADQHELFDLLNNCVNLVPKPVEKTLPYGFYSMTFGQQFQYYDPESLFSGTILGQRLSRNSWLVSKLKHAGVGRVLDRLRLRKGNS